MKRIVMGAAILLAWQAGAAVAQTPQFDKPAHTDARPEAVRLLYPEQLTIPAGKASQIALHFSVAQGLHINSHAPKDEFLIPTTFSIPDGAGVKLEAVDYPPGTDFTLPVEPKTTLVVYTGEFTVKARITAQPGDHMVQARLHYQACDQNACLPPRTITVPIDVIGK